MAGLLPPATRACKLRRRLPRAARTCPSGRQVPAHAAQQRSEPADRPSLLAEATPIKSDFIRFGMPEDFLEDLAADIAAFEQAITQQSQGLEQQTSGTAAMDETIDRAMKALRQLDTIMRNVLRDDIGMLTAWMTASHVERVPRRRRSGQQPPPPTQPPGSGDSQ